MGGEGIFFELAAFLLARFGFVLPALSGTGLGGEELSVGVAAVLLARFAGTGLGDEELSIDIAAFLLARFTFASSISYFLVLANTLSHFIAPG